MLTSSPSKNQKDGFRKNIPIGSKYYAVYYRPSVGSCFTEVIDGFLAQALHPTINPETDDWFKEHFYQFLNKMKKLIKEHFV